MKKNSLFSIFGLLKLHTLPNSVNQHLVGCAIKSVMLHKKYRELVAMAAIQQETAAASSNITSSSSPCSSIAPNKTSAATSHPLHPRQQS
ncbi:hypothetical protein NC651_009268 [Populus alba x Populus x berolinensis]|nr:hypothetical protein NC651_009268 [Populus alba x Populus x berolinensis]